jgi:predicted transcriptional regulator
MEKTTVYLTEDLQTGIKRVARRQGRSEALVIREALATYIASEQERPVSQSIGCMDEPLAPGVDSSNVKSWIRDNWAKDYDAKSPRRRKA